MNGSIGGNRVQSVMRFGTVKLHQCERGLKRGFDWRHLYSCPLNYTAHLKITYAPVLTPNINYVTHWEPHNHCRKLSWLSVHSFAYTQKIPAISIWRPSTIGLNGRWSLHKNEWDFFVHEQKRKTSWDSRQRLMWHFMWAAQQRSIRSEDGWAWDFWGHYEERVKAN